MVSLHRRRAQAAYPREPELKVLIGMTDQWRKDPHDSLLVGGYFRKHSSALKVQHLPKEINRIIANKYYKAYSKQQLQQKIEVMTESDRLERVHRQILRAKRRKSLCRGCRSVMLRVLAPVILIAKDVVMLYIQVQHGCDAYDDNGNRAAGWIWAAAITPLVVFVISVGFDPESFGALSEKVKLNSGRMTVWNMRQRIETRITDWEQFNYYRFVSARMIYGAAMSE